MDGWMDYESFYKRIGGQDGDFMIGSCEIGRAEAQKRKMAILASALAKYAGKQNRSRI